MIAVNFTNTYDPNDYPGFHFIDCSDISGCDMYCDEEAKAEIKRRILSALNIAGGTGTSGIKDGIYEGIHLIDSGNYHYMTRLFTEEIKVPYELVFFDNHTDMKPAMFDMLSCGSWAKEVLEKDKNLRKMYMIGPRIDQGGNTLGDGALGDGTFGDDFSDKLVTVSQDELTSINEALSNPKMIKLYEPSPASLPVYISVDKDILDESEVKTNWDQGNMRLNVLISILENIRKNRTVLGADICGLFPESAGNAGAKCAYENGPKTDTAIINALSLHIKVYPEHHNDIPQD